MDQQRRIKVVCEGHDDRQLLQSLQDAQLVPKELDLSHLAVAGGYAGIPGLVAIQLGAGVSSIALRDMDDLSREGVADWLTKELRKQGLTVGAPTDLGQGGAWLIQATEARVAVVPVGLDGVVEDEGIDRYAVDDFVLRMALDPDVYENVSELRKGASLEVVKRKIEAVTELLRSNCLEVRKTKRLVHVLCATVGFGASPAELVKRLAEGTIKAGGAEKLYALTAPLADAVTLAAHAILPPAAPAPARDDGALA